ncbi:MAG: uncharacterized protein QOK39_1025 [Acidimicrobiaceae bacterium]|jgi:uncharacterized Tic20 family protein|nr:uncharacterized protein [Acidimicrobiaceae bacterium]
MDNRGLAALSHAGLLAMYIVLPLVIRLTVGKKDSFVRAHATEALNGMITFGIFWNLTIASAWIAASATHDPRWLFLMIGGGLGFLWILVNSIVGAVRAYQGIHYRYPGNIRLVRGGLPRR